MLSWRAAFLIFCVVVAVAECSQEVPTVYIILSVKTDKFIVKRCVASLLRHQSDSIKQRVIFVDDGSPDDTVSFEHGLCDNQSSMFTCLKNRQTGYTHAIRYGIETALTRSTQVEDSIVLLNSDVVVTHGWLFTLHQALMQDDQTMIVGPISNAGMCAASSKLCSWLIVRLCNISFVMSL